MSCKDKCEHARYCVLPGSGVSPRACPMYYQIDDQLLDAEMSKEDYRYKDEEEPEDAEEQG